MKRKSSKLIIISTIAFTGIFFVSFLGFVAVNELTNTGGNSNSYKIDFAYIDIEGNLINSSEHKGKVIALYFFTITCPPCKISSQHLKNIEDDYQSSQLLIITISLNFEDSNGDLYNWRNDLDASWIIVRDNINRDYSSQLDIAYTPTIIIIDQNSNFVNRRTPDFD